MRMLVVEGSGGEMVYCKGCGALAGEKTRCLAWDSHSLASTTVPVVCYVCGTIPGNPTYCHVHHNEHDFRAVPKRP
jgi:hypothetical protein